LSFVGSHLCLWTVIFVFWLVVVTGCLWVVIGIGCRVMVAVGGVVGLCSWLVEGRSDVTGCDIGVMFKLAHEITCTISCDFLAVYSKNPSVLVQSWSNLGRGEIQPSGLVSVLLSSGEAHLPTSTSENHPSLAELWQSSAELGRNYRGTIKTSMTPNANDNPQIPCHQNQPKNEDDRPPTNDNDCPANERRPASTNRHRR